MAQADLVLTQHRFPGGEIVREGIIASNLGAGAFIGAEGLEFNLGRKNGHPETLGRDLFLIVFDGNVGSRTVKHMRPFGGRTVNDHSHPGGTGNPRPTNSSDGRSLNYLRDRGVSVDVFEDLRYTPTALYQNILGGYDTTVKVGLGFHGRDYYTADTTAGNVQRWRLCTDGVYRLQEDLGGGAGNVVGMATNARDILFLRTRDGGYRVNIKRKTGVNTMTVVDRVMQISDNFVEVHDITWSGRDIYVVWSTDSDGAGQDPFPG